ncbi:MAG: hypothetical protein ACTHU0_29965, partial [Kofleriaceae bacterium]
MLARFSVAVLALVASTGCPRKDAPAVAPARPLPADPEVALGSMQAECDALIAALGVYKACPNLVDEDRQDLDAWTEDANSAFSESRKASPEANAQRTIAAACRKATDSVKAAAER